MTRGADKEANTEGRQALQAFLLDVASLEELNPWLVRDNIFEILNLAHNEIRHSTMISWLLDPMESHGLHGAVLEHLFQYVASQSLVDDPLVFKVLLLDPVNFEIRREYEHIDILAVNDRDTVLVAFENKIWSGEHDNQLRRYQSIIDKNFPGYDVLRVYLTPDGAESSNPDQWASMSYTDLIDIIAQARSGAQLTTTAELLIDSYIDMIRRNIVTDPELVDIVARIYRKHQKAIDLIIKHLPDDSELVKAKVIEWGKENLPSFASESRPDQKGSWFRYRFYTETMLNLLPKTSQTDAWDGLTFWNYELAIDSKPSGIKFNIQLVFNESSAIGNRKSQLIETAEYLRTAAESPWKLAGHNKRDRLYNIFLLPETTMEMDPRNVSPEDLVELDNSLNAGLARIREFETKLVQSEWYRARISQTPADTV
ncbi:PDDEXK-like family protein [Flaviflexus equikiangi]|uniref:PDDEXK-like family protein n=1 Tax=Flaviflexus equikiangi TaxID=2758573 RepID=UPI0015F5C699|nr:PD-(D/E)XK nuclease family protein [Flaviflexus equikiangi]